MAPLSGPVMLPTPESYKPGCNNQEAVAGRLRQLYRESQEKASRIPLASQSKAPHPSSSSAGSPPPGCPMHAAPGGGSSSSSSGSSSEGINPLNNMPFNLGMSSASASSSSPSSVKLSRERTVSSIRRGESSPAPGASPYDAPSACPVKHTTSSADGSSMPSRWEYPSPEQFQAALARKNKAAPPEAVDMMVQVHNFLNEEGWKLVLDWEKQFGTQAEDVSLLRFQGRPGELSPRARWYSLLGSVWPSRYSSEPPFDRHDWIVGRPDGSTARYIIDYYGDDEGDARDRGNAARSGSGSEDNHDQARFILDVRPALDSFAAVKVRAASAYREWSQPQQQS